MPPIHGRKETTPVRRLTVNRKPLRNYPSLAQALRLRNRKETHLRYVALSLFWPAIIHIAYAQCVLICNGTPGEIALLREAASLSKCFAESVVGQNTNQRGAKLILRAGRKQHDASLR